MIIRGANLYPIPTILPTSKKLNSLQNRAMSAVADDQVQDSTN